MNHTTRRQMLGAGVSLAALGAVPSALAAMGPNDKFDLLIRNANLLDPSQNLSGKRDIGVRFGRVEAIEASIPAERALRVFDAGNKLVTPGLIDLHCHTYPYGSAIGIPADELLAHQCTTTTVSAGDGGANNLAAWRRYVMPSSRTRQFAFVHIAVAGLAGFPVPELFNIDYAQPEIAARAVAENADIVLGVKVRMSENVIARHGMEPLRRAIRACELSGVPAKIMCHIGGVADRALMSQILDALRPGDVLTHCFSGAPNDAGLGTNIVQDGKLLPAALEAKKRGVIFDIGHGGGSFGFGTTKKMLAAGFLPDVISSDVHVISIEGPAFDLLTTMSKFLCLGVDLPTVVRLSTANPARAIGRPDLGTLKPGSVGEATVIEVTSGTFDYADSIGERMIGDKRLVSAGVVLAGRWWHPA